MKNDIGQATLNRYDSSHKSFSYLADDIQPSGMNEFAELAVDISAGIASCLDLVSSSDLARDCGETPTIGPSDTANLVRLSLAASKLLRDHALRSIEWMNEHKRISGGKS